MRNVMRLSVFSACLAFLLAQLPALPAQAEGSLGFNINITLSPKAAAKLKSANEGITVGASYYGDPKKGVKKFVNEMGMLDLKSETLSLPGEPGIAHITGRDVPAERLTFLNGPVSVNVNIWSSRKAGDDNILNCDFIDGEVAKVAKTPPINLHCSLISENLENKTYP